MPAAAPQETPSYHASEAARLLALPVSTVKAWCFGQGYRNPQGERKRFSAVIGPADPRGRLLSFANLCELHILGSITRAHRIPLQKVRIGIEFVRRKLGSPRPLLSEQFRTNGLDLFLEHAGQLVSVTREGQTAMRGEFEKALSRIERGPAGAPVRLFPYSRPATGRSAQPAVVAIDPRIGFGRPIIIHAGVRTEVIADRFAAGDSPEDMAEDYGVPETDILEALRFQQRVAA
ncbi:MAG: DUF433 domain-containing protein [Betaproteobacteria bacterium]|nr:DUF433 domain-containing protein [Betaproteobacteria bacterium]